MIDPMIHANEFKLRLLLTDRCNRRCSFCLNDFQRKPGSEHLSLPIPAAKEYVDLYCSEMRNTVRDPKALRELGMTTLSLLNAHLRSVALTAKAVNAAKGVDHG